MRVTAIQMAPETDRGHNLRRAAELLDHAVVATRPNFVSLPEMWACLGGDRTAKHAAAETLPPPGSGEPYGPAASLLRDLARRHGLTVHGGSIAERVGERLFNTSLVFGPDGAELGRYRKIHLFDVTTPDGAAYGESRLFGAGEASVVCDTPAGRLGLAICYDIRFPELFLALRRQGAELIAIPAAFTAATGRAHWEVLVRARAIETQCAVVAAATCGTHRDATGAPRATWGHAMIVDGWGRVLAEAGEDEGWISAELDLASLGPIRAAMTVLDHRRLA